MSLLTYLGLKKSAPRRRRAIDRRTRLGNERLESRDMLTLIGIDPGFPLTAYNSTGQVHYNPTTHNFDLTATPLAFKASAAADPATVGAPASLALHIQVDNSGHLIGGVAGNDLVVTGSINDGTIDVSGVLLTGEITDFGFADTGVTDAYDFRFMVTGGALASLFAGKDIGVTTTSEHSSFTGSFAVAFDGGAKGNVGTVDQATGSISGHKFLDKKGDGLTADDTPLGGVTIQLFRDADNNGTFDASLDGPPIATTVTADGTGAYSFTNLQPGTYFVKEVVPLGYRETAPTTKYYTVVVTAGSTTTDLDFANKLKCDMKNPCDNPCKNMNPCDTRSSCKTPEPCAPKGTCDSRDHSASCDRGQSWNIPAPAPIACSRGNTNDSSRTTASTWGSSAAASRQCGHR
jgi:SdrD B-like domain